MGKMKDISIELEEAGLDPFDNSNLQGYVDDTHHFGEEIIKSLVTINEQYGAYGKQESDVGTDPTDFELWIKDIIGRELKPWEKAVITHNLNNPVIRSNADQNGPLEKLKSMTGPSRVRVADCPSCRSVTLIQRKGKDEDFHHSICLHCTFIFQVTNSRLIEQDSYIDSVKELNHG